MKLRRVARVTFYQAAALTGLLTMSESRMRGRLTILTYHRVLPDAMMRDYLFPSLAVSEAMFRRQMAALARRCNVVTLEQGLAAIKAGETSERPMVVLTFDDGYADNVQIAAPIMNAHDLRGTFFVVAGLVGTRDELWYDVAARRWFAATQAQLMRAALLVGAEPVWKGKPSIATWMSLLKQMTPVDRAAAVEALPEPGRTDEREHLDRVMTPDELRALQSSGHVIGSHSMNHPLLPQLDEHSLDGELVSSRHMLENWLQSSVTGFCYPNGDYNGQVVAAVKRAGYTHACTTETGRNDRQADALLLRRISMHPTSSSGIAGQFEEPSFRASISLFQRSFKAS